MAFDINNQYTGKFYGQDRIGHTTPDLELSDVLRPWLPVAYPAPYLPSLRQDQGHPKLANIVLSSQHLVGIDKSGALVPAGMFCGTQGRLGAFTVNNLAVTSNVATFTTSATHNYVVGDSVVVTITGTGSTLSGTYTVTSVPSATTFTAATASANVTSEAVTGTSVLAVQGQFSFIVYGQTDIGFAYNPQTGTYVQAAGEHVCLAAPSDAVAGTVTRADGSVVVVSSGDITFGHSCTLFDTGVAKPIGVATRNVYQYIGGVTVLSSTGGITYTLNGVVPTNFIINNYMHEMGTAIQTQYVIRLPWVGATRYQLTADATADGITGFTQGYGLSFAHFTGTPLKGEGVVASNFSLDHGNYTTFNPTVNSASQIVGRILGVMNMINKIGFSNRVRTLWDPSRLVGPVADPNPASLMMGGSATGGIDYTLNLTTDGIYKKSLVQGTAARPEYGTYVIVRVNL